LKRWLSYFLTNPKKLAGEFFASFGEVVGGAAVAAG
jgi:hypothetical protein